MEKAKRELSYTELRLSAAKQIKQNSLRYFHFESSLGGAAVLGRNSTSGALNSIQAKAEEKDFLYTSPVSRTQLYSPLALSK